MPPWQPAMPVPLAGLPARVREDPSCTNFSALTGTHAWISSDAVSTSRTTAAPLSAHSPACSTRSVMTPSKGARRVARARRSRVRATLASPAAISASVMPRLATASSRSLWGTERFLTSGVSRRTSAFW